MNRLRQWWNQDRETDGDGTDSPHVPVPPDRRREAIPLLALAFGWGFLITGLIVGGALGKGLPFGQLIGISLAGNIINFMIGAAVGYVGYRTGCNSGLLYRYTFGTLGARGPAILVSLLTICWQGIIVGAFGFAWTQSFGTGAFYAVAIFGGLLFTATTYFGVKGLELVSLPATFILIAVGLFAGYLNVSHAGGWHAFLALSQANAAASPLGSVDALNLVIASWIVGAIVMPEYTRFAPRAWVAIAIPFVVMVVAQWFLQILGAMGGIASGSYDFTTYMLAQGMLIGTIGLITMTFALWTTGDTNLYLPSVQLASVFNRSQRVMTVICGIVGTLIGLGIYQRFMSWIDLLASLAPPIIGPLIVDFYILNRRKYLTADVSTLPTWNPIAFIAYAIGAASTFVSPAWMVKSLTGLLFSMLSYLILGLIFRHKTAPAATHA